MKNAGMGDSELAALVLPPKHKGKKEYSCTVGTFDSKVRLPEGEKVQQDHDPCDTVF